ncbi:MAG: 30S ribosomal protein S8 [Verrucomicrobia bacterium]|nr:30S ribosomal protein S8 [Verrucomicrobiota bacterium]MBU1909800.1 30S ribosomal protein S8 [Verrucomicrobiota bacterium]
MSVCDPIADMLTRIRNAGRAGLATTEMPHSRLKNEIARILKKEGYIADYVSEGQAGKKLLRVYLKYAANRTPVIRGLRRISKPGLRRYTGAAKPPRVIGGMGIAIISTSKGLMTDQEIRRGRLGGEVLCYVW